MSFFADDLKIIERTVASMEDTEQSILQGLDEHLDIILDVQKGLSNIAALTSELADDIERNSNSYTTEKAKDMLIRIFPIFRGAENINTSIINVGLRMRSKHN